jgi:hypothetical protein
MAEHCYAECRFFSVSFMLSVTNKPLKFKSQFHQAVLSIGNVMQLKGNKLAAVLRHS